MTVALREITEGPLLSDLLEGIEAAPAMAVTGLASDSRRVKPGDLFIAVAGASSHGAAYIDQALGAGAAAVAWDSTTTTAPYVPKSVVSIGVPDLATQVGLIANRFFDWPSAAVDVIGITGTNGKTTVAWLVTQCCELLGEPCGYLGTLGFGLGNIAISDSMTTPDVIALQGRLAEFRDSGATTAAIEVSSHALDQHRVAGTQFSAAVFTNLSRDHLDYHGDMAAYSAAKARLFLDYPVTHRVINLDSEFGAELAERCATDVTAVSTQFDRVANGRPFVFARSVVARDDGSQVRFTSSWGDADIHLPLIGDFNVANALIVLALLLTRGVNFSRACEVMQLVSAPPGRLQRVGNDASAPAVFIDYAHTPAALDAVLQAVRPHCRGNVWCVFGCGGNRDVGKRPLMAAAADRRAEHLIITSDNPRDEDPARIISEIAIGLRDQDSATLIEDRATAIAWAIDQADEYDVVVVAGKGHESHQQVGDRRVEFSDAGVASAALAKRRRRQS